MWHWLTCYTGTLHDNIQTMILFFLTQIYLKYNIIYHITSLILLYWFSSMSDSKIFSINCRVEDVCHEAKFTNASNWGQDLGKLSMLLCSTCTSTRKSIGCITRQVVVRSGPWEQSIVWVTGVSYASAGTSALKSALKKLSGEKKAPFRVLAMM